MSTANTGTWLRASDASALLGVSRCTLHRWIVEGAIERRFLLKTGRQYRIARAFCEGRHLLPTAPPQQVTQPTFVPFPGFTYSVQAQA